MTDETTTPDLDPDAPEEIVPDYSRVGFRQLQALCKARGIPADGKAPDLIDKLKARDAQHGLAVDTDVPDADEDEVDLLADDMPAQPDSTSTQSTAHTLDAPAPSHADEPARNTAGDTTPESPAGDGPGASLPSPVGTPTPGAPAVVTVPADPAAATGLPPSTVRNGRPNLAIRDGIVKVGEGHGAAEVRAYRREYVIGQRDISDTDHARFIEETHAAAHAEGLATKGGVTIGERVGYATDANNQRTAIYQVPLKRQR
jgi:hypothetical protein